MINQALLFEAKAFLCWEKFDQLSIKLIPITGTVAFFYPPTKDIATIHLFYKSETEDFGQSLCLLFHEAGHYQQWHQWLNQGKEREFWNLMNIDKGDEKITFEREAWDLGRRLLDEFIERLVANHDHLRDAYDKLARESILTYYD